MLPELDDELRRSVAAARERVDLCSPFVGHDTATWLAKAAKVSPAAWTLLTRLDAVSAAYGSLSLPGLRDLAAAGVQLLHAQRLHAKVFLTDTSTGFLGSGNLTGSGLGGQPRPNLELGVSLNPAQSAQAGTVLAAWRAAALPITAGMIDDCEREAAVLPVATPRPPGASDRSDSADRILAAGVAAGQVWIKALYADAAEAEQPWGDDGWVASPAIRKPSFAPGDLLLIYASYTGICNAVVRVVGPTRNDPAFLIAEGTSVADTARWPWVTPVEGLLQVPVADGVPLQRLGLTGQSLQNGHTRMPVGGLAAALRHMTTLPLAHSGSSDRPPRGAAVRTA